MKPTISYIGVVGVGQWMWYPGVTKMSETFRCTEKTTN